MWSINCGHKPPNVFIPGLSLIRGAVDTDDPAVKAANDKAYALRQQKTALERDIREAKRDAAMYDAIGDKTNFDKAAYRVKQKTAAYNSFVAETSLTKNVYKTQVDGYNRSVAAKVNTAARRIKKTAEENIRQKAETIAATRDLIKSGATKKVINAGHQNKHILSSKGYIDGKSYIYGDLKTAQMLVDHYAGTGEIKLNSKGEWTKKEFVTVSDPIGVVIRRDTGERVETNRFSIHYGKNGTHIVPAERK